MVLDWLDKDLVLYLPFSEGAPDGSTVAKVLDRSQEQNHGTVSGAVLVKPYEDMSDQSDDEGDNPDVIYDDDETMWNALNVNAGSYEIVISEETTIVKKGASSLKMLIQAGAFRTVGISHTFPVNQDWSQYDYITVWFYGTNSGNVWYPSINMPNGANRYYTSFTDNFSGWKRFFFAFEHMSAIGNPDLSDVDHIQITGDPSSTTTNYLDRTTVDVGNWRFGEAVDFDGVNDNINLGTNTNLRRPIIWSISAWCYAYDWTDLATIWSKWQNVGWLLYINNGIPIFSFGVGDDHTFSNVTLNTYEWFHIVITYDGTYLRCFVNGKLEDVISGVSDKGSSEDGGTAYIGDFAGSRCWHGLIDECRLYNRALSSEEIRTLYSQVSRRG